MTLLIQMQKAIQDIKDHGGPVISEYRIHPDDLVALRKQIPVFTSEPSKTLFGLRLVEDEKAPRLPLKATA